MANILDIIEEANEAIDEAIGDLPRVTADKIGLDRRAGTVYVDLDNEMIIAEGSNIRSLDYYGGFEYVGSEYTATMGRYKMYFGENARVEEALEQYAEHHEETEEV